MTRRQTRAWGLALAVTVLVGWAAVAAAQDAEPPPGPTERTTLLDLWRQGRGFMYPIGLLSVAGVALTIYGFLSTRESKMLQTELVPTLQETIGRLDFRTAASTCSGSPGVMSNIFNAGLSRITDEQVDLGEIEKAMEEASVEESAAGLKPISYISIIATIAPMFGLLGTVSGMISAFQAISLGAMGDPERLGGDIGEAMITTAFGLLVGIPMMFFYFFLKSKFQSNMARIGRVLGNLSHQMASTLRRAENGALTVEPPAPAPAAPPQD